MISRGLTEGGMITDPWKKRAQPRFQGTPDWKRRARNGLSSIRELMLQFAGKANGQARFLWGVPSDCAGFWATVGTVGRDQRRTLENVDTRGSVGITGSGTLRGTPAPISTVTVIYGRVTGV